MAFIFTCGTHTFNSLLKGYENITVQCQNCGNFSGKVRLTSRPTSLSFPNPQAHPLPFLSSTIVHH